MAYTTETLQVLSWVLPQKDPQRKENDILFPLQLQVPLTQFEVHANLILQSFLKKQKFLAPPNFKSLLVEMGQQWKDK